MVVTRVGVVLVLLGVGCAAGHVDEREHPAAIDAVEAPRPPVRAADRWTDGARDDDKEAERGTRLLALGGSDGDAAETAARLAHQGLFRWSFEPASPDCNGWIARGAESIRAVPARSGSYSCKLCADGSTRTISLWRRVSVVRPGRYAARAWMRAGPGVDASLLARVTLAAATSTARERDPQPIVLGDEWNAASDTLELTRSARFAHVTVEANARAGQCLFVDDVSVEREVDPSGR